MRIAILLISLAAGLGWFAAFPTAAAAQQGQSRYSGHSGGSRALAPMSHGLSDAQVGGGYGFTRKSHFRNSENNRSHFRNGLSTSSDYGRSDFGHRSDRNSKLKPLYDANPPARPWRPLPELSISQPAARFGPSRRAGAAPFETGSRAPVRQLYPGFAAELRAKEMQRLGGPPKPYRGLFGGADR